MGIRKERDTIDVPPVPVAFSPTSPATLRAWRDDRMSTLTPAMTPEALDTTDVGTGDDLEARVIVFNCDCHTYQQVIALFCKCIPGMNSSRAFELAWRIDHEGQATVYSGERKAAEEIGKKLAAGGLRVGVQ